MKLSPYNIAHSELDSDCCGIFMDIDKEGLIICNECNIKLVDVLRKSKDPKIGDRVRATMNHINWVYWHL